MKKAILGTILVALVLAMFAGCGSSGNGSAGTPDGGSVDSGGSGGTASPDGTREDIIIAQSAEPASLDPHNCYELTAMRIYMNIFDSLLRADADGQLHPSLAESWDVSEDGMTYTFQLREGVSFQNGDPFTAADVKYSFERAMGSPYCLEATEPMDSVEVLGDYEVAVHLKYSYPPQLNFFSTTYLAIVNEKVVNEQGDDFSINPAGAGTGAYQFVEWQRGVSVTMESFEGHFAGAPAIKRVVYRNIPEESAGAIAVESGNVDIFLQPSTVDVPNLMSNPDLEVYMAESYYCEYLAINTRATPFDSVEVRRAISLAIDKEDLILAAVDGIGGNPTGTVVSSRSFGHNSALEAPYGYDPEQAKQLLADAGYPDGFDCTITTIDGARKKVAEAYQAALAQIGINASVSVVESGTFYEEAMNGDGQLYVCGMTALPADADPILYSCFADSTLGVTNYSFYENAEFERLLAQERADGNAATRAAALEEMQQMIYDDVPVVPSYFRVTIDVCNANIKGFAVESHNLFYVDTLSW